MDSPHEKQMEALMNAALASYSEAVPRPGLEDRILARATSEVHATRAGFLWKWAAASCMAAVLACVAVLPIPHRHQDATPHTTQARKSVEKMHAVPSTRAPEIPVAFSFSRPHRKRQQTAGAAMRRPIAQAPLSQEEELLLSVAAEHPEVLPHNVEHQNDPVRLLTVSELNKPLSPEPPKQE